MPQVAVIVTGGDPISPLVLEELPRERWVIAADSGLDHALSLGLEVHDVIGDLDSVTPAALQRYPDARIDQHLPDKDSTDLELAMGLACERSNIDRVIVIGGLGGRLDHLLANAAVMASRRWAHVEVDWIAGVARISVIHDHRRLHGSIGEKVSLIAHGGNAAGVTSTGLKWQLADDILEPGSSRGVSNEFVAPVATVMVRQGALLAVQPEALVVG